MNQQVEQHIQSVKPVMDAISIGSVIGTLMGWLPAIAAFLSIVWTLIRIYETETVRKWLKKK
jgi:uncharacterized membrane protein (Fun14 family)